MSVPDRQLGANGEKLARLRLEMALQGAAAQFSGFDDKGLDLLVQFQSPIPDAAALYVGVQVKTGPSFGKADGAHWRLNNISAADLDKWSRSNVPVMLVWVRPSTQDEYLWTLITKDTNRSEIRISRRSMISPSIRFDLTYQCSSLPRPKALERPLELCRPSLVGGLRQYAKGYYRSELLGARRPVNPLLGPVTFSWAGWEHLTARKRKLASIHSSLQLLSTCRWAIENPNRLVGIRRLPLVVRGGWLWESRLLAFECSGVPIRYRAPSNLAVVIRQQIVYPSRWNDDANLSNKIRYSTSFLSIYEKGPIEFKSGTQR